MMNFFFQKSRDSYPVQTFLLLLHHESFSNYGYDLKIVHEQKFYIVDEPIQYVSAS